MCSVPVDKVGGLLGQLPPGLVTELDRTLRVQITLLRIGALASEEAGGRRLDQEEMTSSAGSRRSWRFQ